MTKYTFTYLLLTSVLILFFSLFISFTVSSPFQSPALRSLDILRNITTFFDLYYSGPQKYHHALAQLDALGLLPTGAPAGSDATSIVDDGHGAALAAFDRLDPLVRIPFSYLMYITTMHHSYSCSFLTSLLSLLILQIIVLSTLFPT